MAEQIEIRVGISAEELVKKCRACFKNDGVLNLFLTRHKDIMLYHLFPMLSLPELDPSDVQLPQKICGICAKAIFEFYAFKESLLQTQIILELAAGKLRYLNIQESENLKPNNLVKLQDKNEIKPEINENIETLECDQVVDDKCTSNSHELISQVVNNDNSIREVNKTNKNTITKCRLCKKKFSKYSDYLNHRIEEREKKNKVQCPICNESIMSYRLENHLIAHRIKGNYFKEHVNSNEAEVQIIIEEPNNSFKVEKIDLLNNEESSTYGFLEKWSEDSNIIIDHDYVENSDTDDENVQKNVANEYVCVFCDLKFESRKEYINHRQKEKEKRQKTPCLVCDTKIPLFQMEQHSISHKINDCTNADLLIDENSGELTCSCCNEMFDDENEFHLHIANEDHKSTIINKYACSVCQKHFTLDGLKDHMRVHNRDMKQYMCEVCGKQFSYKTSLRFHKHSKIIEESLCDICGKSFSSKYNLRLHKRRVHVEVKSIPCKFCGKTFKNNRLQNIHMRQHTTERPYECIICGEKFTQSSYLQTHIKAKHTPKIKTELIEEHKENKRNNKKVPTNKKKKDKCDICNHLVLDLLGHKLLHEAGYTYVCGFCNEGFNERYDLTTHKISVHFAKRRVFTCDICNKSVTTSQMLESHRRIHTGEKPFKCKLCTKSFTQGSHLNTHMKWHTGEKEFECKFCKKRFSLKGNLKQHLRSHTGDKPFCCDICKKCFPTASGLRKHTTIHLKHKTKTENMYAY